jgi:Tfp pilus assembly protein PilO
MAALKSTRNLTIVAMLIVTGLAIAFWMLLLGPKRDEAARLGKRIARVERSLSEHRAEVAAAKAARKRFPVDYQRLVVLGKAVPGGDETASLLIQVNGVAARAEVELDDLQLDVEGGSGEEAAAAPASAGGTQVSATEAAASLTPLGASVGPAGLAVMPYTLTFSGNFFQIADFLHGLDAMVKSNNEKVAVNGRLITINGFVLAPEEGEKGKGKGKGGGSPTLTATFSVTTYLTPPSLEATGGATPSGPPEGATGTPASTTTGGTP